MPSHEAGTDGGQQKEQKWQLIYHIQPFLVSYSNGGPAGRQADRQPAAGRDHVRVCVVAGIRCCFLRPVPKKMRGAKRKKERRRNFLCHAREP